jgi:membrane peptidoglycan carboxypeptidase
LPSTELPPAEAPADELSARASPATIPVAVPASAVRPSVRRQLVRGLLMGAPIVLLAGGIAALLDELDTSRLQSRWLAEFARDIDYTVVEGRAAQSLPPDIGPYDVRLGYARLPELLPRLQQAGYRIERQASASPRLRSLHERGLHVLYPEKTQTGLRVLDANGAVLSSSQFPRHVYYQYAEIPPLVVRSLTYVEDRELLDLDRPYMNPVVDWERLGKAVGLAALNRLRADDRAIGASTLATQIEKFRHSRDGITHSASDKFRQMASATLRAYRLGAVTVPARRQLVLDYLNALPLAALPGYGEVSSLGDGLEAWYGSDFATVNRVLSDPRADIRTKGRYYKEVLSLILSVRRPAFYLMRDVAALERLTDSYLRVMAAAGQITPQLRDAALAHRLRKRSVAGARPLIDFAQQKGANLVRNRLLRQLDVRSVYELDRFDLHVQASIDGRLQSEVTRFLRSLREPAVIDALGLNGARLLAGDDPSKVIYSFTLYERRADGNRIRVNADNLDQPLDINGGVKLDLGSTAKLRTLVTYLELVAEVHGRYQALSPTDRVAYAVHPKDQLAAWVVSYLRTNPGATLTSTLEASLLRSWSASPGQVFFTGGGAHRFANFERSDNGRVMTLQEALRRSVNLVFIRVMREVVDHYLYRAPSTTARLLENADDPQRQDYLRRFADREGNVFLRRFHGKYGGKSPDAAIATLLDGVRVTPRAVAVVLRSVRPEATQAELAAWLARAVPDQPQTPAQVADLYIRYGRDKFSLNDRAYLARVHPLELWLLEYLRDHPTATRAEVLEAGAQVRQDVYAWLWKTNRRRAQDRRILDLLEIEAFQQIHAAWQRVGYPFASLTPSLATSIGSSGDRPAALAELMGIIQNDGERLPNVLVEDYHFAAGTPYEVLLGRTAVAPERVLPREVAQVTRRAILDVVENGTARSLLPQLQRADGSRRNVGGKTGTGDHRFEVVGAGGRVLESRVVNRVATFMFYIDDRFYGTITAFVPGAEAADYEFTSGLPVRLLGTLMPTLAPSLDAGRVPVTLPAAVAVPAAAPGT